MKRKYSYNDNENILYLVATPIGNLDDITFRALEVLKSVDCIYAEDTRTSGVLLNHFRINTSLYPYHDFNKEIKEEEIIDKLKKGQNIAIISDAGNPVISDPGYNIAVRAIKENISVTTIPGACAYISALVASGLPPMPNTFYGFLDSKKTKRIAELESLKFINHTIIFYEAPHRILETLDDMLSVFGDREIVIARELTKKFEEFIRGTISEVKSSVETLKGEIVLLVSGYVLKEELGDIDYTKKIDELISIGLKSNEAIKEVSRLYNVDKKQLYSDYVAYKNTKN